MSIVIINDLSECHGAPSRREHGMSVLVNGDVQYRTYGAMKFLVTLFGEERRENAKKRKHKGENFNLVLSHISS